MKALNVVTERREINLNSVSDLLKKALRLGVSIDHMVGAIEYTKTLDDEAQVKLLKKLSEQKKNEKALADKANQVVLSYIFGVK